MKDSTLLKLSLSCSMVGLLILLVMTEFIPEDAVTIDSLSEKLGDKVYIQGVVKSVSYKKDTTFLSISDSTGETSAVIFDAIEKSINKGDEIGISGEVSLYKGKYELIVSELVCLRCGS